MPIEQIIGWVGNYGFFLGAVLVANKKISGWVCQLIANVLYIYQSWLMGNNSLMWLSIVLGCVNIYGVYQWSRKK